MTTLDAFLDSIVSEPSAARSTWLILADWLDDHDAPYPAELIRLHQQMLATCCEPDRHPQRAGWQSRMVELLGQGVRPIVPQHTVTFAEGVEMPFAWIPPGKFLMGSPEDEEGREDEEPHHRVTLTKGFWLAIHAVTQAQWRAVMGSNPSWHTGDDTFPVEEVSWEDCQEFCVKVGKGFRLPTEAEWEYSGRAGTTTPFFFGDTISTDQANYDGRFPYGKGKEGIGREETTPVGSFLSNAWGLFDMHGNVWEWCQDWYGEYAREDAVDPQGSDSGVGRVLRGGSFVNLAGYVRSAYRNINEPANRNLSFGFRPARTFR